MATLAEIRDRVKRNLNREDLFADTPDSSQYDDNVIDDAINDTIKELLLDWEWRIAEASQSITLVQGTTQYALPADFMRSESMFFSNAQGQITREVQYVDKYMFEKLTANEESLFFNPVYIGDDSRPLVFTIEGENVVIKPMTVVSGSTLVHKYYKSMPALVQGSVNTNYFTDNYPRLLEYGATTNLLDVLIQPRGDDTSQRDVMLKYEREKSRVIASESRSKGTQTIAISNRV